MDVKFEANQSQTASADLAHILLTKIWGAECCVMGVDAVPVHVNNRIQYGNTNSSWVWVSVDDSLWKYHKVRLI